MIRIQKLFAPSHMDNQVIIDILLQKECPIVFQLIFLDEFLELLDSGLESECKRVEFKQFFHHLCPRAETELIKGLGQLF